LIEIENETLLIFSKIKDELHL